MAIYDYQGNELYSGATAIEPQENDIPVVTLACVLPTSKNDGEINAVIEYKSMTDNFRCYGTVKVQGDSSTSYPKKNFTIKLFSDSGRTTKLKKQFRNWDKKRNKFVLKANWIDHSHARNIVNARLWTQIMKSRSDYSSLPSALTSGNLAIDGFPVKVYNNGVYMGLYTWNLPKDSLYGLDDEIESNAIVQGDSGSYSGSILWRSSTMDGKWSDETHDTMTNPIVVGFNALLNFVYTSTDSAFANNFATYFDKQSVIDQYIFLYIGCIVDNIGKNQTFFTYNGSYYYGGMYDMDGTWGLPPWNVASVGWKSAETVFQTGYSAVAEGDGTTTNLLYDKVGRLFASDIVTRYNELRASVLSADNINAEFERFMSTIPPHVYAEDYASTTGGGAFTDIPLKTTNNIQQIRQFVVDRLAYVDSQILS